MLPIPRFLRARFLIQKKITKYFLYAIGEVFLVVIGILIALQIGAWNKERENRKIEKSFLLRLHNDLAADTTYLLKRIEKIEDFRQRGYKFIHEIYNFQETEEDFKKIYRLQTWDADNLVLQTSTFEELKNIGLLNIISKDSLRINLIKHYKEYETAAKHINEINNFSSREIFSKSVSIAMKYNIQELYDEERLFSNVDWQFINNPQSEEFKLLENTQMHYFIKYGVFLNYYTTLLKQARLLLHKINEELRLR